MSKFGPKADTRLESPRVRLPSPNRTLRIPKPDSDPVMYSDLSEAGSGSFVGESESYFTPGNVNSGILGFGNLMDSNPLVVPQNSVSSNRGRISTNSRISSIQKNDSSINVMSNIAPKTSPQNEDLMLSHRLQATMSDLDLQGGQGPDPGSPSAADERIGRMTSAELKEKADELRLETEDMLRSRRVSHVANSLLVPSEAGDESVKELENLEDPEECIEIVVGLLDIKKISSQKTLIYPYPFPTRYLLESPREEKGYQEGRRFFRCLRPDVRKYVGCFNFSSILRHRRPCWCCLFFGCCFFIFFYCLLHCLFYECYGKFWRILK